MMAHPMFYAASCQLANRSKLDVCWEAGMPATITAVTTVCARDVLPEAIPWAKRIWSGAGRVYKGPRGSWVDIAWRTLITPVSETLRQEMALFPDIALLVVALLSWDWDDSDVLVGWSSEAGVSAHTHGCP